MTIFFMQINGYRNVAVLLRWHVNYEGNGVEYPYYYEVKSYKHDEGRGYIKNLDGKKILNYLVIKSKVTETFKTSHWIMRGK